ncbi:hypothetical protein, partial [Solemya velum gill symbiont]|uniref:hypothetical protein n=1 Tax=Solemya velum gill symbiont TaxID=2340 RepID=UPI001C4E27E8
NGTHVQSLWHSLLKNDGQMKMNGLGLIDQTFLSFVSKPVDLNKLSETLEAYLPDVGESTSSS